MNKIIIKIIQMPKKYLYGKDRGISFKSIIKGKLNRRRKIKKRSRENSVWRTIRISLLDKSLKNFISI
jgi:hypothetical protein